MNFTLEDILKSGLAFLLFTLVILIPGYVIAWAGNLFRFKERPAELRLAIAVVTSFAISPVLFFLVLRFLSMFVALVLTGLFFAAMVWILIREKLAPFVGLARYKPILLLAGAVAFLSIASLVDLHWDEQLHFSTVSFDMMTRVSIVDAMTRTGVPPINPSYFPGHFTRLNFLYYFWYILSSIIDVIGGKWVDARAAFIASTAWCGIGLVSSVALYLYLRSQQNQMDPWKPIRLGIGLLAVSGFDIIPVGIMMVRSVTVFADIEHWNSQITAWAGSLLWVPHHVAAMIACLFAMLVMLDDRPQKASWSLWAAILCGAGFASAVGLSIWVPLVFAVFWGIWLLLQIMQKKERAPVLAMLGAGLVALLLVAPFLMNLRQEGSSGSSIGQFPLQFEVRSFYLLENMVKPFPKVLQSLIMGLVLPVNYLFELGFFFVTGLIWIHQNQKEKPFSDPFKQAEVLLLSTAAILGSFVRSSLIINNDFGWRAWLPGQFILLIWAVDVLRRIPAISTDINRSTPEGASIRSSRVGRYLTAMLIIGVLTSAVDLISLRIAGPINAGLTVGENNYSARLAFQYLRDFIPSNVITQNNPLDSRDRSSGLYGTHQMVIAFRTAYGVPRDEYQRYVDEVSLIFAGKGFTQWEPIDRICDRLGIQVLILNDTDPIWSTIDLLTAQRQALYANRDYRIFACGQYASE